MMITFSLWVWVPVIAMAVFYSLTTMLTSETPIREGFKALLFLGGVAFLLVTIFGFILQHVEIK